MISIVKDAMYDVILMLPLLFITYLLLEYMERKDFHMFDNLKKYKKLGLFIGSLIAILPQCGISVAAAGLYAGNAISIGTLISVFIATSDEAIPILLTHPEQYPVLFTTIIIKVVIAFMAGYIIDCLFKPKKEVISQQHYVCHNHDKSITMDALKRSFKIAFFVFVVNLILNSSIYLIGEDMLFSLLMNGTIYQPLLTAIFGFIPNCAITVVLTQLFIGGGISYGSFVAGLITNAGLGLLILIKTYKNKKEILFMLSYLLLVGFISGTILQYVF